MSRAPISFTPDQLEQLANVITRTTPGISVAHGELEERLLDLLQAVGRADDGTEYSIAFRDFAKLEPSHAELAKQYRAIAASDDPLNSKLCSGIVITELNQAARRKWARRVRKGQINRPHPLRGITSEFLTEDDFADVREMALHLADYHQSFVRRQQPIKIDQNTLIERFADIYIDFAELDCDRYELPHAESARFIQFIYLAMRPFFGPTEASLASISKRWKRLKDLQNQAT